jgi:hypothetical protein
VKVRSSARTTTAHGEEWTYVVRDGDVALSLELSVHPRERPLAWIVLHRGFPLSHGSEPSRPCEYVESGVCMGNEGGGHWADTVWSHRTGDEFEQGESFWRAFEAELDEAGARARAQAIGVHGEGI